MNLTITGYSTALYATWYFIEELALLFDAGDGLCSGLLSKTGKIRNVFISHADRDHLMGLLQFNQLNARKKYPVIHYPKNCGSFPALEQFSKQFDPHVQGTVWHPIVNQAIYNIKDNIIVEAVTNGHVPLERGTNKSFSYKVYETKRKLKPEFESLSGQEIKQLNTIHGKDFITNEVKTNILSYSGDTPVEDYERFNKSKILIHEATFLGAKEDSKINTHGNHHSYLEDVIKMVSEIQIEQLILGHFSSRYSHEQINDTVLKLCKSYNLKIPVYTILPGITHRNILAQKPINE